MADFVLTPWESRGRIDYGRLVEMFGLRTLDGTIREGLRRAAGGEHYMVRRGVFFAHRDLDMILESHRKGGGFFVYTGRGPSGGTHIGHLVPWVFARWLQERFGATVYFQLTDDEKFYHNPDLTLEDTARLAEENARDFAALGFDPLKTHILTDTRDAGVLYPLAARVAKRITLSTARASFGFGNHTNIGMVFYTAMQSAPCFLEDRPVLIPLGVDQDPHFRLTRDVAPLLNRRKPALIHNIMTPGLGGSGSKMSAKDANSAIYTADDPRTIRKKINKYAFSGGRADIATHRRLGGDTEADVSYQYMRMFFEPDDRVLSQIREEYESGMMLTGELKQMLIERVTRYMEAHRARRDSVRLEEFWFDHDAYYGAVRR